MFRFTAVRTTVAWAAVAVLLCASFALQWQVLARTGFQAGDFRAFYCAGRVAGAGADPYLNGPLHACEASNGPQLMFRKEPRVTVPAPLPGYVLAVFVPLARLPFGVAAAIWLALLTLATIAAVACASRFSSMPPLAAAAAFGISVGVASIPFGEVVPIAVAAICACAYFAWRGRWWGAAFFAAVAMIEPHVGLPLCVGLLAWAPKARVPVLAMLGVLAALSFATLGPATNVEYFARVLPAHALSEAARDTQFSLTGVLTSLGVKDVVAVRAGMLDYFVMLAAGAYAGGVLARVYRNDAFVACVPPAFAVLGGTFIHVTQIAIAIPAVMLLLAYAGAKTRVAASLAFLLLSVPWIMAWSPALGIAPALPIAMLAWYERRDVRAVVCAAVLAFLLLFGLTRAYALASATIGHAAPATAIDRAYAEAAWADFSHVTSTGSVASWLGRIPTWTGLALLIWLLAAETARALKSAPARRFAKPPA